MKKDRYSFFYLFMKFMFLMNIIFFILATSFFILHNQNLLPYVNNPYYQDFLPSLNQIIFWVGGGMFVLNAMLFAGVMFSSHQRYFRMLDKIDFENLESSLNLLKNFKKMDEFGYMGEKLKSLLKVYLHFSYLKKNRIEFEQKKFYLLMDLLDQPSLLLLKEPVEEYYQIRAVNQKCLNLLKLQDKRSIVIGKKFDELLNSPSVNNFYNILESLKYEKSEKNFSSPIEAELRIQTNLAEIASLSLKRAKSEKEPEYSEFYCQIFPFVFQWSDQPGTAIAQNPENQNTVVDSVLVLFKEKKGFWKS